MCSYFELPNVQRFLQYPNQRSGHCCQIIAHHRSGDHHANGGNSGILLKADRAGAGSPGTRLGRPFGPGFALRPGLIGRTRAQSAYARRKSGGGLLSAQRARDKDPGFPGCAFGLHRQHAGKSTAYSACGCGRARKRAKSGTRQRRDSARTANGEAVLTANPSTSGCLKRALPGPNRDTLHPNGPGRPADNAAHPEPAGQAAARGAFSATIRGGCENLNSRDKWIFRVTAA